MGTKTGELLSSTIIILQMYIIVRISSITAFNRILGQVIILKHHENKIRPKGD